MEKEFIQYNQALALKELGFDEPCFGWFSKEHDYKLIFGAPEYSKIFIKNGCLASPTYSQAFRWFRDKYDLHENVGIKHFIEKTYCYNIVSTSIPHYIHDKSHFASYEEAELECLKKLIEIVKEIVELESEKL